MFIVGRLKKKYLLPRRKMMRRVLMTLTSQAKFTKVPARSAFTSAVEALKEPRKFYQSVTVIGSGKNPNEFEISLDKRRLKTPMGRILSVPSEALALAVAEEWNSQQKTIKRESMHLTTLCNTVIDNPRALDANAIIDACLNFLPTDTLLYRCEEPPALVKIQTTKWDPVLKWFEDRFNVKVPVTTAITPLTMDETINSSLRSYLGQLPLPVLFAVVQAVESSKSLILALAVLNKAVSVVEAAFLARLEQNFQIDHWGNVEWHHDIEHHDVVSQLASACLYFHYVTEKHTVVKKK